MIQAKGLTKYYGERAAVADLSFEIKEGEVVGLLGLNGAGKTTTLKILSGGLLPSSGQVRIGDLDMAQNPEAVRSRIGFLPEVPPLYPEMRVAEYLKFVANIKGMTGDVAGAVNDALAATELVERKDDRIDTLSHGFKRRVGIAHAIVHRPALILLDEPTSGLDPVQVVQMRTLIRSLGKKNTILISSHILSEITQLCDRILVLQDGRIAAEGTEEELGEKVARAARVQLEVRGERDAVVSLLKGRDEVKSHTVEREDHGVVVVNVELKGDTPEALAKALIDGGLGLRRMEPTERHLENIFLRLTGKGTN